MIVAPAAQVMRWNRMKIYGGRARRPSPTEFIQPRCGIQPPSPREVAKRQQGRRELKCTPKLPQSRLSPCQLARREAAPLLSAPQTFSPAIGGNLPSEREPIFHPTSVRECNGGSKPPPYEIHPTSFLIPHFSLLEALLSTPYKVYLYADASFFALKRPKNGVFELQVDCNLYFCGFFAKIGQKTRKKALKIFPFYVTIIICGGMSPFPFFSFIFYLCEELKIWTP